MMRGDKLNGVHLPGIQLAENVRFVGCTVRGEGACPNGVIATTKIGGKFFLDDRIGIGDDRVDHARRVDRKSTRLTPVTNAHLVCRLLLEKKNTYNTQLSLLASDKHIYIYSQTTQ